MSPTAIPTRITIDFRDAALPSRTWILGVDEAAHGPDGAHRLRRRADRATAAPGEPAPGAPSAAVVAECACPDFCERDHANE